MYDIEYSELARKDMLEVAFYIMIEFSNEDAALKLIDDFEKMIETRLSLFPYSNSDDLGVKTDVFEYHCILVRNYLVYYEVFEKESLVLIQRVINDKRNFKEKIKMK